VFTLRDAGTAETNEQPLDLLNLAPLFPVARSGPRAAQA
jgi:hypothetical protein